MEGDLALAGFTSVKAGIKGVEVLGIQLILRDAECLTKALEMDDFTLAEELNRFADIGVIYQAQDVIISGARLLFCSIL